MPAQTLSTIRSKLVENSWVIPPWIYSTMTTLLDRAIERQHENMFDIFSWVVNHLVDEDIPTIDIKNYFVERACVFNEDYKTTFEADFQRVYARYLAQNNQNAELVG